MNIFKGLEFVYNETSKNIDDIKNNSRRFEDSQFVRNASSKSMEIILTHKEDIANITKQSIEKLNSLQSAPKFQAEITDFQNAVSELLPFLTSNFPGALDETDDIYSNNEKQSCPTSIQDFDEDKFLEQLKMDLERRGATDLPSAKCSPASAQKGVSNEKSELPLAPDSNISLDVIKKPELCEIADVDQMFENIEEEIKKLSAKISSCDAGLEEASRLFTSTDRSENSADVATSNRKAERSPISNTSDKELNRVCLSIENLSADRNRYQSKLETNQMMFQKTPFNTYKSSQGEDDDLRKPPDSEAQSILKSSSRFVSNKQHIVPARVTFSLSEENLEEVGQVAPVHKRPGAAKSLFQSAKENSSSKPPLRKPLETHNDRKQ